MQHIEQLKPEEAGITQAETGLWVPGEHCAVHLVDKPGAPRRKWPALLPWLLEDRLLSSVEANHFVAGGESDGKLVVTCVARNKMQAWLQQAEDSGCELQRLLPDYLALPWQEGEISVAPRTGGQEGDAVWLVRYGAELGFAAAPQLALKMLQDLLKEQPQLSLRACCSPGNVPESLQALQPEICGSLNWNTPPPASRGNLLCGEFKPRAGGSGVPQWLPTAALLVLTTALCFVWLGSDNRRLAREVEAWREAELAEFYRRFPGVQLRGQDVRGTVEQLVSDSFLQRDQLQMPTAAMLQKLDAVINDCGCRATSLELDVVGGQLQLEAPVVESVFSDYTGLSLQPAAADAPSRILRISPELL